jgi:hypothetical protein
MFENRRWLEGKNPSVGARHAVPLREKLELSYAPALKGVLSSARNRGEGWLAQRAG